MPLPPRSTSTVVIESLLSGGRCRISGPSFAAVGVQTGVFRLSFVIGMRADRTPVIVTLQDSVTGALVKVLCLPTTVPAIANGTEEELILATERSATVIYGGQAVRFSFLVTLPDDTGEWILGFEPGLAGAIFGIESFKFDQAGLPGSVPSGTLIWGGEWDSEESYDAGAVVSRNASLFILRTGTGITADPVDGDPWDIAITLSGLPAGLGIGLSDLTPGTVYYFHAPGDAVITGWDVVLDVSGSLELDLWNSTTVPTVADTIVAAAPIVVTAAQRAGSTALTGWSPVVTDGDVMALSVTSATTATAASVRLYFTRTF